MKKKTQKARKPLSQCNIRRAVKYARVSTPDQEKEGFSIPAQLRFGDDYALQNTIDVVETFIDVDTAKKIGRSEFNRMVKFLRKNSSIRIIIVEKTDRLYRNIKDFLTIEELDVEIHFF